MTDLIEIEGALAEITIAPNPTGRVFRVLINNLPRSENHLDIEVLDATGQIIQSRTIGKWNQSYEGTISLYDYPDGIYYLRILHTTNMLQRIVKQ